MEKPKFVIVIEKGAIVEVYSDAELEYAIVNYDKEEPVEGVYNAVEVRCDLKELWNPELLHDDPDGKRMYKKIYDNLIEENF